MSVEKFVVGREYSRYANRADTGEHWRCDYSGKSYAVLTCVGKASDPMVGYETTTSHESLGWNDGYRLAPRIVERWIVEAANGLRWTTLTAEAAERLAQEYRPSGGTAVVAGPFQIELPW